MHRYLSGNTKVILRLKRVSVVNSHWLYPSLMTYMLKKLRGSPNFISPPQCKYLNFHISKIFIYLDVYLDPIH